MLISCPSCKTNFSVPAKAIGDKGKKVKCTKCSNIWLQEPITVDKEKLDSLLESSKAAKQRAVEDKAKSEALKESGGQSIEANNDNSFESNLPAKLDKSKQYYILGLLVIVMSSLLLQVLYSPTSYKNYASILSIKNYDDLKFVDFKVDSEVINDKVDFFIEGKIFNTSSTPVNAPDVDIRILSSGGRLMNEVSFKLSGKIIPAKGYIEVSPEISGVSGNASEISMSFGNWVEKSFQ